MIKLTVGALVSIRRLPPRRQVSAPQVFVPYLWEGLAEGGHAYGSHDGSMF